MKVVAVSQRVDVFPERNETRDALDQDLVIWLRAAGYMPYPVPNALHTDTELRAWLDRLAPCGLVLSGGNDIGMVARRDFTEEILIQYAERRRLPLLGICRGMQMMARQCLTPLTKLQGHVRTRHQLRGEIEGEANSFHGLGLTQCPFGYRVLATSEDKGIEAIGHVDLPWEGWMWHPERENPFAERDLERLRRLFG